MRGTVAPSGVAFDARADKRLLDWPAGAPMSSPAGHAGQRVMTPLLLLVAIALPNIDLPSNCRTEQKAIPPNPAQASVYEDCMRGEQAAREGLVKKWATVPAAVRATCAEMGRLIGSYVEIAVCVDIDTGNLSSYAPAPPRHRAQ
jgi:hypothetical protein